MKLVAVPPFELSPAVREKLQPSPTLHINERVAELWAAGREVYHLGFGESRFPVHPKIQDALRANVHRKSYLAGQGLAELRAQIAQFYSQQMDRTIDPDQVIVGPGSKAILYALQMALDAELILPTPSWVSYAPQAQLLNKAVRHIPASPEDGYALSLDALDATLRQTHTPNKILLITSPNNPTGQMYEPTFLAELADFCRQHGVLVLSDEIYSLVCHGYRTHVSISHFYPEGSVVLSGLSKHLSLGGWRLGSAVLPDHDEANALMLALRAIASEIWSTPTGPIQYAGITAYSNDPEITAYIDECARIHAIRTQFLWRELTALGIPCAQPDGAFYVFPNFDPWREPLALRGVHTSTDLAEHLLDEYQLATLPGTAFATPASDLSLRLASSYLDMETDAKADAILAAYRANPDPGSFMRDHHPMTHAALARLCRFVESLG